jgi:hypothetical protein
MSAESWQECISQERAYTLGWRDAVEGKPERFPREPFYAMGYRDGKQKTSSISDGHKGST